MKLTKIFVLLLSFVLCMTALCSCTDDLTEDEQSGDQGNQPHTHAFVKGVCECGEKDPNYAS